MVLFVGEVSSRRVGGEVFGELIRRRRELGFSQRDLAEWLCGVTGRATLTRHELSRYERGVRLPRGPALAVCLDLPVTVLRQQVAQQRARRRAGRPSSGPDGER